ncbi:hypothetical protein ANO11243_031440 [Dothideomycetidae sp. 11243]|nr:hypothetical protein ANO11243_031440 [fungal sp. No.11243]
MSIMTEFDLGGSSNYTDVVDTIALGLEISRPRSALHRGDFGGETSQQPDRSIADSPRPAPRFPSPDLVATSPPAPWHDGFPNTSIHRSRRNPSSALQTAFIETSRPRAISGASLAHSFSYQAPTSPLVNQSNAEDLTDDLALSQHHSVNDRSHRRRTFSPASLQSVVSFNDARYGGAWDSPPLSLRRESTVPYQAHQPRRSISSIGSLPQTPLLGGRRSSGLGSSPLQHAMVGSFEESILRGRMSTTPSRPLDFTAHIGVLGMGDCKPSLKCPPHIIVPFPAVFYSYGNGHNNHDSQPSPYVGLVDLENAPAKGEAKAKRKIKTAHRPGVDVGSSSGALPESSESDNWRRQKAKRRSHSPLDQPKSAYRIPPKGQLQIIIKNPNKTAVKLFLVPYDVSDMQPGQKTFIRQRSYSAGPVLDAPSILQGSDGPDKYASIIAGSNDHHDRPVLRYLVHLHICCTMRGHMWLYKSIRVVFANRVPDGKERLRNETQLPEPKYSLYRPHRASATSTPLIGPQKDGSMLMDIDSPSIVGGVQAMAYAVRQHRPEARSLSGSKNYESLFQHRHTEQSFRFPVLETVTSRPSSRGVAEDGAETQPHNGVVNQETRVKSPRSPLSPMSPMTSLASLQHRAISPVTDSSEGTGSFTFSRSSSAEKLPGVKAESLLSRRLRDLEMNKAAAANAGAKE